MLHGDGFFKKSPPWPPEGFFGQANLSCIKQTKKYRNGVVL
jgi:hypothetical protein